MRLWIKESLVSAARAVEKDSPAPQLRVLVERPPKPIMAMVWDWFEQDSGVERIKVEFVDNPHGFNEIVEIEVFRA